MPRRLGETTSKRIAPSRLTALRGRFDEKFLRVPSDLAIVATLLVSLASAGAILAVVIIIVLFFGALLFTA